MSLFSSITLHLELLAYWLCFATMSVAEVVAVASNTELQVA